MIRLPNTPATQAFLDLFWAVVQKQDAAAAARERIHPKKPKTKRKKEK